MSHKVLVEWTIPFMARGSEFPWLCLKIHLPLIHTDNTDATNAWQLGVWQFVKAEIELNRRNFVSHKHDWKKIDLIICWKHDWKECPWRWWNWGKSSDRG